MAVRCGICSCSSDGVELGDCKRLDLETHEAHPRVQETGNSCLSICTLSRTDASN